MLDAREDELIGKLDQIADQKIKNLTAQKDEMETIQTQLISCQTFVRESLRTGSQVEVMKMKKTVMKQIKEITDNFKPDMLPPCEHADMKFESSPKSAQACQQFGEVSGGKVSPKTCYATGEGLKEAELGKRATTVLHIANENGNTCTTPAETITSELVASATGMRTKCSIKNVKAMTSQYKISYQPTIEGRHQLHIKVEGEHIKGSPFPITVKLPVKKLVIADYDPQWDEWG